jgi:hypothetical protein
MLHKELVLYIYIIYNISDVIYNYFSWEISYYIFKNYKIKSQSYIGLIYGSNIIYYYYVNHSRS